MHWTFVALAGEEAVRRRLINRRDLETALQQHDLQLRLDSGSWSIFASPDTPCIPLSPEGGAIVGRLFVSGATSRVPAGELPAAEVEAIGAGGGKYLVDHYWGSFVALLNGRDAGGSRVLRDPSGAVPVYYLELDGAQLYFSDPDLIARLGLAPATIDPEFLRQWLLYRHLRTARTGLAGVKELLPGVQRVTGAGTSAVERCWSPWPFADARAQFGDADEAALALRKTALRTIPAYAEGTQKVLLELSGGLDSSIIAASLANAGTRFAAVNFVTRSADGDERRYARIVAAATGASLTEVEQPEALGDLLRTPRPLVRPGLSPVLDPIQEAFAATAREVGADRFMSGAGGDSVFCYLTTAAPAIDAARQRGPGAALRTLGDVSRLCGCTYWTAARYALRKALRPRSTSRWPKDASFLTPAAADARPDEHPWLEAPRKALPGKRQHVEAIVTIFHFLDRGHRGGMADVVYPLLAQPLVELCLRIPTWMWVRGGRNRAVARQAFKGLVPEPILLRGGKGRLESMCADAYARSRPGLRSLLLDGRLATDGLIDRASVEAYLRQEPARSDLRYFRIFDLATLELWARSWESQ